MVIGHAANPRRYALALLTTALVAAGALAASAPVAGAAEDCTISWTAGTDGVWGEAGNWTPARVPNRLDRVCFRLTPAVRVDLGATTSVAQLRTGAATVVVAEGASLGVKNLVLNGRGGFAGPGSVHVAARRGHTTTAVVTGATPTLADGIDLVSEGITSLAGQLTLTGGSTWNVDSTLTARDGAAVADDGDPGNLVEVASTLSSSGDVTIAPPVTLGQQLQVSGTLRLPRLVGATPDGTITLPRTYLYASTIVVPYPITTLRGGPVYLYRGDQVVVQSTGADALATLTRVIGYLDLDGDRTLPQPVVVDDGDFEFGGLGVSIGTITAPAVRVIGGELGLLFGTLRLGDAGSGTATLCADTTSNCSFRSGGGVLDGSLRQVAGKVVFDPVKPSVVTGGWTNNSDAFTRLTIVAAPPTSGAASAVAVTGAVRLLGRLQVDLGRGVRRPPVGTVQTLVTAGSLQTRFSRIVAPPGWEVSATTTAIVATYRGVGAAGPHAAAAF